MGRWCVLPREARPVPSLWIVVNIDGNQPAEGDPRSRKGQRVADSRVVLTTRGQRSTGNSVEGKTPTIRTQDCDLAEPDYREGVVEIGEVVDVRWQ